MIAHSHARYPRFLSPRFLMHNNVLNCTPFTATWSNLLPTTQYVNGCSCEPGLTPVFTMCSDYMRCVESSLPSSWCASDRYVVNLPFVQRTKHEGHVELSRCYSVKFECATCYLCHTDRLIHTGCVDHFLLNRFTHIATFFHHSLFCPHQFAPSRAQLPSLCLFLC
jgi:hypothetical protein